MFWKKITNRFLNKVNKVLYDVEFLRNVNNTSYSQNCLLVYITHPFIYKDLNQHQNIWQVRELAKIISDFDFNVDVLDYTAASQKKLKGKYDLIINIDPNSMKYFYGNMNKNCKNIGFLTGANLSFSNQSEQKRIEQLFHRNNFNVIPRRQSKEVYQKEIMENLIDAFFLKGNKAILDTYKEFSIKKMFFIRNNGCSLNKKIEFKNKKANSFLFLASVGQVFKGLDLLLDIFSKRKDLTLYVCSNFKNEDDFCELYKNILFKNENIHPVGFLNVSSAKFNKIASECSYMISPSCSEGCSGSVLTAMAAGLIPVMTKECGVDNSEAIMLENVEIEYIEKILDDLSKKSLDWIEKKALKSLEIYYDEYSNRKFTESVYKSLEEVLKSK